MKKVICASALSLLILGGCGNKVDGTYTIDIGATKATPDFVAKDQKSRGIATMGLQVFGQLAATITIEGSQFRLATLDCKLNAELTTAECKDPANPSAPAKALGFSLADGVVRIIDPSDEYPVFYRNMKGSSTAMPPRKP